MVELANFPFKDQLTEQTADARPPENARFDCVDVSFAAAIQWYDGGYVSGDELKDAEYGETYANAGTALRRYVDDATDRAREVYHVTAEPYNNTNTAWLVGRIHTWLQQGYPVIASIPSDWSNFGISAAARANPNFSTHVICFYGEIAGGLEAMNPWHGFRHTNTDAAWANLLCYAQIWAIVKEETVLDIAHALGYYTQKVAGNDTAWICTKNKLEVHGSVLAYYRAYYDKLNGLTYGGLPRTLELFPIAGYNGCLQVFERFAIAFDPAHKFDRPPGVLDTDACYLAHIDVGPIHDWLLSAVEDQLKALQAQLLMAQNQEKADAATINDLKAQVGTLTQTIAELKAAPPPPPTMAQAVQMITDQLKADGKL